MKSFLLLTLIGFLSITTNAQFTKGSKLLGGSFGFSASSSKTDINAGPLFRDPTNQSTSFSFRPTFGFFTSPTLVHGFRLHIAAGRTKGRPADVSMPENTSRNLELGAGYFLRKCKSFGGNFGGFAEAGLGYLLNKSRSGNFEGPDYHNITLDTRIGIYYAIRKDLLIDAGIGVASVGYQFSKQPAGNYRQWNVNGGLSTGVSVGIQFILP